MKDAILTFAFIVISLLTAALVNIPLFIGFAFGLLLVIILLVRRDFTTKQILFASLDGVQRIKPVIYILGLISLLIPAWMESGTVATMIYYIVSWIEPNWILLFAFSITAVTSFILGTAIGTLGSLGMIIIGVAISVDVPTSLVAGALVSGAFLGDRCSPVSSAFHLAANSVDSDTRKLFNQMVPTTIIMIIFCLIFYYALGYTIVPKEVLEYADVTNLLLENYRLSLVTLLPIIVLFASIILNVRTVFAMVLGVGTAVVLALTFQQQSLPTIVDSLLFGYTNSPERLDQILKGGGLVSMVQILLFITLAGIMNGIIDQTQLFKQLIKKMFEQAKTLTSFTVRTVVLGVVFAIVGCNQAFPVMLTGKSVKETWIEAGFRKEQLGRVVCDSALVTAGLIPWNMAAILSAAAIGVSTIDYALYAALLWIGPFLTILVSYFQRFNQPYHDLEQKGKIAT